MKITIVEMYERAIWKITTIPFPCLIFTLCRESTVTMIARVDTLIEVTRMQDVGLIKDDTNLVTQRRGPRPEVQLLKMFKRHATEPSADRAAPEEEHATRKSSRPETTTAPPTTSAPTHTPRTPQSVDLVTISAEYL